MTPEQEALTRNSHHVIDFVRNMDPKGPGFCHAPEPTKTLEDLKPAPHAKTPT